MKCIKEKAKEVFPDHCNAYTDARNKDKRIGFEAGANYVLECIELYCKEHVVCNTNIKHLIEQLKK